MFKPGDHVRYVGNKEGKPMTEDWIGRSFTVDYVEDDTEALWLGVCITDARNGDEHTVYAFNLELEDINA